MVSVHVSMEDWPAVRRDVDRLVALVPHCVRVYEERAACFKQFGQHKAALKDLKSAADMDPANWIVQMNMADECVALAKYAEAIEAYQRQIRLVPDRQSWLPRYNIGIAYKFSGKYEEAIKAFLHCKAKATDDCPDNFIKDCDEQIEACEAVLRRLGRPSPQVKPFGPLLRSRTARRTLWAFCHFLPRRPQPSPSSRRQTPLRGKPNDRRSWAR